MTSSNNLLVLNLGVDTDDTSLGFTQTWIEELNKKYTNIDVITMRLGKNGLDNKIGVHFINTNEKKLSKIKQLVKIHKTFKSVLIIQDYDHCFAHMSPLLFIVGWIHLRRRRIKTTLWFTHPGPRFGLKKLILLIATLLANNVVTASTNSFPYNVKKLEVIGHGIDFSRFERVERKKIKNFLYLGRISKSKHVDVIVNNFIKFNNSNGNQFSLTLIGGPLNVKDNIYLDSIKKIIGSNSGITIAGKIPHSELNRLMKEYDCNINLAGTGFFDKAVLETLHAGLINICYNDDYKQFYSEAQQEKLFIKNDLNELEEIFDYLIKLSNEEIQSIIDYSSSNLMKHSLQTMPNRLSKVFSK